MVKKITALLLCLILTLSVCTAVFAETTPTPAEEIPAAENTSPQGGTIPQDGRGMGGGRGGFGGQPPQMPEGTEAGQIPQMSEDAENGAQTPSSQQGGMQASPNEQAEDGTNASFAPSDENAQHQFGADGGRGMGSMFPNQMMQDTAAEETQKEAPSLSVKAVFKEYFTPIISLVLLALAFVFVIFYKRKKF